MTSLAVKYRPTSFDDMVGQDLISTVLPRMADSGTLQAANLFCGPSGSGKTTAAKILAARVTSGEYNIIEIDAASHGGVSDVRALLQSVKYLGGRTVVILDEAHSMSRDAFNALLVGLESPPENVVFILVTTEPQKIPDTVLSRLYTYEFRKVTPAAIAARLRVIADTEGLTVSDAVLSFIASKVDGNVRRAIMLFEQAVVSKVRTVSDLMELTGDTDIGPYLLREIASGDPSRMFDALDSSVASSSSIEYVSSSLIQVLSDILIIKNHGDIEHVGEGRKAREELASVLTTDLVLSSMRLIWDLRVRMKSVSGDKDNLQLLVVLLSQVLQPVQHRVEQMSEPQEVEDEVLSFEDLAIV